MRLQFLLASIGAIALSGSAFAAEPLPPPPPPVPIFTWTGLYIGGQVGGAWDRDPTTVTFFSPVVAVGDTFTNKPRGVIGGAHIGYNLQINQWVAGVEGTVDGTSIRGTAFGPVTGVSVHTREEIQGSVRARLGIAFDRVLIYATGGAAFTGIDNTYTGGIFAPGAFEKISRTRSGWTVGGGIAYAITNNWSIRAEYRYSDFGRYNEYPFAVFVPVGATLFARHHLTQHQVQFGVSYRFETSPFAPVVAKY
jgi:outer membrane immunogenic protein